jgi:hypothetical protein
MGCDIPCPHAAAASFGRHNFGVEANPLHLARRAASQISLDPGPFLNRLLTGLI